MEPVPQDKSHEQTALLRDIEVYTRECAEADAHGSSGEVMLAIAQFIQKQFSFGFEEALRIVHNSRMFTTADSGQVVYEKAAIAPLKLMDMYVEAMAYSEADRPNGPLQSDVLTRWYSSMAIATRYIASKTWHTNGECCDDELTAVDPGCYTSEDCPLRVLRQLLVQPALSCDFSALYTYQDSLKRYVIVDAKLTAALDCGLLTNEQKDQLEFDYHTRLEAARDSL